MRRLPQRFARPVMVVLDSLCMAALMSTALTLLRMGFVPGWPTWCARSFATAFPIALIAAFLIPPRIHRFVGNFTEPERNDAAVDRRYVA